MHQLLPYPWHHFSNYIYHTVPFIGHSGDRQIAACKKKILSRTCSLVICLLAALLPVRAVTITWKGSVGNGWINCDNWSPNTVPTASDDVIIAADVPNDPLINTTVSAQSVTIQENAGLIIWPEPCSSILP